MIFTKICLLLLVCCYCHFIQPSTAFSFENKKRFEYLVNKKRIKNFSIGYSNNDTTSTAIPLAPALPVGYGPFYIDVPLNHDNNDTGVTFKNRYWINADYYQPGGPIIFANAGEAEVKSASVVLFNTTMAQLTERLNGIFVYMEHRFYGESTPVTNNNGVQDLDKYIPYLSSEQALADMAYLLQTIEFPSELNVLPVPQTKVIVYGCSYSGNLAAWMKDKYPDLVFAAVASSAPVQAQTDFHEYFDPIIRYGPSDCIRNIRDAIAYIDSILFGNSTDDIDQLKKLFGAEGFYDDDFASYLLNPMAEFWQYGIDDTTNLFENIMCNKIFKNNNTVQENIIAYAAFLQPYSEQTYCDTTNSTDLQPCFDTHNATSIQEQKLQDPSTASWLWQTCTEFGYFQVAPPSGEPSIISRKLAVASMQRLCQLYFGNSTNVPELPDTDKTNQIYGGWNIRSSLQNMIWIDGEWDSWRELSVLSPQINSNSNLANSIILPKSTHCANYAGITSESPQYLVDAQNQQFETLKAWLDQANNTTTATKKTMLSI
ncbi:peptidase S28 [Mycotypha africana]|uniref:peptidase S28 n=1 Tax=Mycotypha africana TaxID=64632 RepID=UPI0023019122|nr:peptidase S28 [Mycotypha africana]KAI8967616.1 peptidase S28 [Mycotypha africana]